MTEENRTRPSSKRARRMAREPREAVSGAAAVNPAAPSATPPTKAARVEALLVREVGASLDDMCQATGWLPHSCRAFLTGLRKKGRTIERGKREDGIPIYRLGPRTQDGAVAVLQTGDNA